MRQSLGKAGSALLQSDGQPGRARAAGSAFRHHLPRVRPSAPRPATSHQGDSFASSVCLYLGPSCCSRYADLYLGDIWNKLEKGLREMEGEVRRPLLPGWLGCGGGGVQGCERSQLRVWVG